MRIFQVPEKFLTRHSKGRITRGQVGGHGGQKKAHWGGGSHDRGGYS